MCEEVLPLVRDPEAAAGTRAMLKPLLDRLQRSGATDALAPRRAVRALALLAALLAWSARPARADAGWFESGDTRCASTCSCSTTPRSSALPVNQWPMPRAAVRYALANAKTHFATNAAVAAALERVRARLDAAAARRAAARFDAVAHARASRACCATSTRSAREDGELARPGRIFDRRSRGVLAERHRRRRSRRRRRTARSTARTPPCSRATGCCQRQHARSLVGAGARR